MNGENYIWKAFKVFIVLASCVSNALPVRSKLVMERVVGGTNAVENSAPYIVSIQNGGVHYCSASLLNSNWLLTAAHCITRDILRNILVAGSINVAGTASTAQKRAINRSVKHKLYTGGAAPYDIGLIYTSQAFKLSAAVQPIALPKTGVVPKGSATLYGWGSTSTTNVPVYPKELKVANDLPIIDIKTCENALKVDVHTTNVCTGPLTGGVGICTADSGGPLVQSNTIIGIVSWSKQPCGQVNSPSVYVRVSSFIAWIDENQK